MTELLLAALKKARFALEELLAADAVVFFENIFSTRHIGRVVDLMVFQSQEFVKATENPGETEYRFRHIVELLVFNGWSNYRAGEKSKCLEVEFGWDKTRLIVSVTSFAESELSNFMPGAAEQPPNAASERMAKMFAQVQALADGLVVRHDPGTGRLQALAFVSASASEKLAEAQYLDVRELPQGDAVDGLADPVELSTGDVDAFVADESAEKSRPARKGGLELVEDDAQAIADASGSDASAAETVVPAGVEETSDEDTLVAGSDSGPDETETIVKGGSPDSDDLLTVLGGSGAADDGDEPTATRTTEKITTESIRVSGKVDGPNDEEIRLKGDGPLTTDEVLHVKGGPGGKLKTGETLKVKGGAGPGTDSAPAARREQLIQEANKRLQAQVETLRQQLDAAKSEKAELQQLLAEGNGKASEALATSLADDEASVGTGDLKIGKDSELSKYKEQLDKGVVPESAKNWAKGMMEVAIKERSELKQRMRDVDALLRKREYEFKSRESAYNESIRMLEANLKSRESALEKSRESLANLSATLEKVREQHADSQDKVELAHKLVTAEKLLAVEKENAERAIKRADDAQKKLSEEVSARSAAQSETAKYKKQVDDLQRKLTQLQETANKGSLMEIQSLTEQRDKHARFIEELKRQIKELQTKLSAATTTTKAAPGGKEGDKKAAPQATEAELKHKLEIAERLAKVSKDELDKTKKRFDDLKTQETKLRADVSRLQVELAKAQNDLKAAGIRSATAVANKPKPGAPGAGKTTSHGTTRPIQPKTNIGKK